MIYHFHLCDGNRYSYVLGGTTNGHKLFGRPFGNIHQNYILYTAFQTGISLLEFILQIDPMCTKIYASTSSLKHCLRQQKTGINLNIHYQGTGYINSNEPRPQKSMHYIKRTQEINIIYYGIISKDKSENSRK